MRASGLGVQPPLLQVIAVTAVHIAHGAGRLTNTGNRVTPSAFFNLRFYLSRNADRDRYSHHSEAASASKSRGGQLLLQSPRLDATGRAWKGDITVDQNIGLHCEESSSRREFLERLACLAGGVTLLPLLDPESAHAQIVAENDDAW